MSIISVLMVGDACGFECATETACEFIGLDERYVGEGLNL